jgi:branched-chain amino acid transport system permease protein
MDTTTPPPTSRSAARLPKPVGRADAGRTSRRTWRPLRIARLVGVLVLVLLLVTLPLSVGDRFWLSVLATSGVYTLGAVGLNLLTGYLGEASLGHAFFMGVGAYVGIYVGDTLGAPLLVWMVAVLAAGALVGAISGPLALRLRGGHLLMVTLALVFVGQWIFTNWRDVTGGPSGRSVDLPLAIGSVDFGALTIGGTQFTANQGFAVLVWLCCVVAIVLVRNVARSRTGRAMRAIHDNELAASAAGVSLLRAKMGAFIFSSALAALCGAFYAQQLRYLEPAAFGLLLSIQFVVILIIGGSGSTAGPVIGGLFVGAVPLLLQRQTDLPFILGPTEGGFGLTPGEFSNFAFAALLVLFLLLEPGGITRILARLGRFGARLTHRRPRAQIGER